MCHVYYLVLLSAIRPFVAYMACTPIFCGLAHRSPPVSSLALRCRASDLGLDLVARPPSSPRPALRIFQPFPRRSSIYDNTTSPFYYLAHPGSFYCVLSPPLYKFWPSSPISRASPRLMLMMSLCLPAFLPRAYCALEHPTPGTDFLQARSASPARRSDVFVVQRCCPATLFCICSSQVQCGLPPVIVGGLDFGLLNTRRPPDVNPSILHHLPRFSHACTMLSLMSCVTLSSIISLLQCSLVHLRSFSDSFSFLCSRS